MEQLYRGAFKTRTGSETQKGSQSQGGVCGKWRGNGAKSSCLMLLWGGPGYTETKDARLLVLLGEAKGGRGKCIILSIKTESHRHHLCVLLSSIAETGHGIRRAHYSYVQVISAFIFLNPFASYSKSLTQLPIRSFSPEWCQHWRNPLSVGNGSTQYLLGCPVSTVPRVRPH